MRSRGLVLSILLPCFPLTLALSQKDRGLTLPSLGEGWGEG